MNALGPLILGGSDLPTLLAELHRAGVSLNPYAEHLLPQVAVAMAPAEVQVMVTTVAELGFAEGAPLETVIAVLAPRGLAPCPLEVAPRLRLADHRWSPRLTVLSPRLDPDERAPRGFYLRDDPDGRWLRAFVASEDWVAPPEERLALLALDARVSEGRAR